MGKRNLGGGTTKQEKTLQSATRGFHKKRKDEERTKGGGGTWGGGADGRERQRKITVHEINILVPKGINKNSVLSSVQGTQGMATAWIFATMVAAFLGFGMILLLYSWAQYTVCDIFLCIIYILMS